MTALYQIANEYNQLLTEWAESETPEMEQAYLDTLEGMEIALVEKGINVGAFILNRRVWTDAKEELAKKLLAEVKRERGQDDHWMGYLKVNMLKAGISEIKANDGTFTIKLGRESKSLIVDDLERVPKEYVTTKTVTTESVDKNQLKKLIEEGTEISGVHIEVNQSISIK